MEVCHEAHIRGGSVVTLIGRVRSEMLRSDAERIARGTKGVKDVNNELTVGRINR
jgi:osmotically-inducible protein OsmY